MPPNSPLGQDTVAAGLIEPTSFTLLPDGRILISEKSGIIRLVKNGALLATSQLKDVVLKPDVLDTQATPEAAVTAWERVMGGAPSPAVVGPTLSALCS